METKELYKFIKENADQCSWSEDELYLWMSPYHLQEFAELINRCSADDGGLDCKLQQDGTVFMVINDLCEDLGIFPEKLIDRKSGIYN